MPKFPELNRRRLLLGLASASAAGAAVALAGAAVVAAADESDALMRLGDELPVLEASYLAALEAKNDAYRRGMRKWPMAPDILVESKRGLRSLERDVAGGGIRRPGDLFYDLWTLDDCKLRVSALRKAIARPRKDPSKPFSVAYFYGTDTAEGWKPSLKECNARLAAAERYYSETDQLRELSGYEPARVAEEAARIALVAHVSAIMAEQPTTMAGVVIHAQALAAFGKVERFFRVCSVESWPWAATFAANVLRIAEDSQAQA